LLDRFEVPRKAMLAVNAKHAQIAAFHEKCFRG
jgi:hypothetical protein